MVDYTHHAKWNAADPETRENVKNVLAESVLSQRVTVTGAAAVAALGGRPAELAALGQAAQGTGQADGAAAIYEPSTDLTEIM
jgi:hypothetical protein